MFSMTCYCPLFFLLIVPCFLTTHLVIGFHLYFWFLGVVAGFLNLLNNDFDIVWANKESMYFLRNPWWHWLYVANLSERVFPELVGLGIVVDIFLDCMIYKHESTDGPEFLRRYESMCLEVGVGRSAFLYMLKWKLSCSGLLPTKQKPQFLLNLPGPSRIRAFEYSLNFPRNKVSGDGGEALALIQKGHCYHHHERNLYGFDFICLLSSWLIVCLLCSSLFPFWDLQHVSYFHWLVICGLVFVIVYRSLSNSCSESISFKDGEMYHTVSNFIYERREDLTPTLKYMLIGRRGWRLCKGLRYQHPRARVVPIYCLLNDGSELILYSTNSEQEVLEFCEKCYEHISTEREQSLKDTLQSFGFYDDVSNEILQFMQRGMKEAEFTNLENV